MNNSRSEGTVSKRQKLDDFSLARSFEVISIEASEYKKFLELITCKTCSKRIDPPIKTCIHGSAWCQYCRSYNSDACSEMCHFSSNKNNTMLNMMIEFFSVECSYTKQGCTVKMKIGSIIGHEKFCNYRGVSCLVCKNSIPLIQLNEHILSHHGEHLIYKTDFFECNKLRIRPQDSNFGYFIFYIRKIQKHFVFEYHFSNETACLINCPNFSREKNFGFCFQCVGVTNEAFSYLYEFKIDQGLDSYYFRSEMCTPYKDTSRLINFRVSEVFLTKDFESGFDFWVSIKPRCPDILYV